MSEYFRVNSEAAAIFNSVLGVSCFSMKVCTMQEKYLFHMQTPKTQISKRILQFCSIP